MSDTIAMRLKSHANCSSAWNMPEAIRREVKCATRNQHGTRYAFTDGSACFVRRGTAGVEVAGEGVATYLVTVTDTLNGDLNFSWVQRYRVNARSPLKAIFRVKKHRYIKGQSPRHRVEVDQYDEARIDIVGHAIAYYAEYCETDPKELYHGVTAID